MKSPILSIILVSSISVITTTFSMSSIAGKAINMTVEDDREIALTKVTETRTDTNKKKINAEGIFKGTVKNKNLGSCSRWGWNVKRKLMRIYMDSKYKTVVQYPNGGSTSVSLVQSVSRGYFIEAGRDPNGYPYKICGYVVHLK